MIPHRGTTLQRSIKRTYQTFSSLCAVRRWDIFGKISTDSELLLGEFATATGIHSLPVASSVAQSGEFDDSRLVDYSYS